MIKLQTRELKERSYALRCMVFDVDGVMTEGELTYGTEDTEQRRFYVHDGIGLMMAKQAGIKIAILTGKNTPMVARRAKELKFDEILQGYNAKETGIRVLSDKLQIPLEQMAYIGDDIHDIPALKVVGLPVSVVNARTEVKQHCVYVTQASGGHGAVREMVEWILELRGERQLIERQFSSTEAEKEAASQERGQIAIRFGSTNGIVDILDESGEDSSLILADAKAAANYNMERVQSLTTYENPSFGPEAATLLEKFNTLTDRDGERYSSKINVDGYETWWAQQFAAINLLETYCRYKPLLQHFSNANQVTIYDCPGYLANVFDMVPFPSTELRYTYSRSFFTRKVVNRAMGQILRTFRRVAGTLSLAGAMIRRPQVMIFTSDVLGPGMTHDMRLEKIYRALSKEKVKFVEVFGSVSWSKTITNTLRRRRFGIYRDRAPTLLHMFANRKPGYRGRLSSPAPDEPPEQTFLHNLAERKIIPDSVLSVRMVENFSSIVRLIKPKKVLFIDDSRYMNELILACKLSGVLTLGFQHGIYPCIAPGLTVPGFNNPRKHGFDEYYLWSSFFVEYMKKASPLFTDEELKVGGLPWVRGTVPNDVPANTRGAGERRIKVMFVVEDYDAGLQDNDVFPFAEALMDDPRIHLQIKLRRGQRTAPFSNFNPATRQDVTVLTGPIDPYMMECDVVVGSWSTAVLDAIFHRRPVVLFPTSRYDDPLDLVRQGVAVKTQNPDEIAESVVHAADTLDETLSQYKDLIWGREEVDTSEVVSKLLLERS